MSFLVWFSFVILLVLSVPIIFFCIEILVGLFYKDQKKQSVMCGVSKGVSSVVLIPAHNEALVINRTLSLLKDELEASLDRVLVVADNCTDDTAELVRSLGFEVVERFNLEKRGKGFALDYAVRYLEKCDFLPEVVVILDADCQLKPGSLTLIKQAVIEQNSPVQAINRSLAPNGSGITQRVSEFAVRVKNIIRNNGLVKLGFPAVLNGTGMGFPFDLLRKASLANSDLAEDMKLGVDMTIAGHPAKFLSTAEVISEFPVAGEALKTQRERWEHGHLTVMKTYLPSLAIKMVKEKNIYLMGTFLDLCIPPLSLLVILTFLISLLTFIVGFFSGSSALAVYSLLLLFILGSTVITAWWHQGRDLLSVQDLLRLPIFILSKIGVYRKFVSGPQTAWVRTKRDGEDKSS